jgi:hypothetical protein
VALDNAFDRFAEFDETRCEAEFSLEGGGE